jgi:hypothetical protein
MNTATLNNDTIITPPADPGVSDLDSVIGFFEVVFTGTSNETADQKAKIKAIIESAFAPGYVYNGKPMSPDALIGFREALLAKFDSMVFRAENIVSGPIDTGTAIPTVGVAFNWASHAVDANGGKFILQGMNMVANQAGKAISTTQLGDAMHGWQPDPS